MDSGVLGGSPVTVARPCRICTGFPDRPDRVLTLFTGRRSAAFRGERRAAVQYFEPNFLDEALVLLDRFAPDAHVLAGGTILGPLLRSASSDGVLVNVKRVRELHDIEVGSSGVLRIGALVTPRELCESELVLAHAPLLASAAATLGAMQLRNVATIGGNVCSGISSADLSVVLLACDARCIVAGEAAGPITVPLDQFLAEPSARFEHRLLTAVEVPVCASLFSYQKMQTRQAFEIALVGVAVAVDVAGGTIARARVALGGAAPRPIRANKAERHLAGKAATEQTAQSAAHIAARDDAYPQTDHRASAEYRRQLVSALVLRALTEAFETRSEAPR